MDDNNKILLLLILFPFYTKIIIMFICLFYLLYLLFPLLLLLPSSDYSETLLYQVATYAYCHHVWLCCLWWTIFACGKNWAAAGSVSAPASALELFVRSLAVAACALRIPWSFRLAGWQRKTTQICR